MEHKPGFVGTYLNPSRGGGFAQFFVPQNMRARWIHGGGRIVRKADPDLFSPQGKVILLKHAQRRASDSEPQPQAESEAPAPDRTCSRDGCSNALPEDLRRKVCDQCRTS